MERPTVCVFAGGRGNGNGTAFSVGESLAASGVNVVFGGGKNGSMGHLADGYLSVPDHGSITGVIPDYLRDRFARQDITVLTANGLSDRKQMMFRMSDAFLALPGAIGTLDEVCSIWAEIKLGEEQTRGKKLALYNEGGFWNHFLRHVNESCVNWEFMSRDRAESLTEILSLRALNDWCYRLANPDECAVT